MAALGFVLLFIGGLLLRQVYVGRADSLSSDARDAFSALLSNDYSQLSEVGKRRGSFVAESDTPTGGDNTAVSASARFSSNTGGAVLAEMLRIGGAAKGYRLGGTGPEFFDCSGLVWRAMRNLGITNQPRFTTWTFPAAAGIGGWAVEVDTPMKGDIVDWYHGGAGNGHMGIVTGPDTMYSALSTKAGIRSSKISPVSATHGQPHYWRFRDAANGGTSGTYSQN